MYLFGEGKQLVDRPISVGSKIVESGSFRHAEKHDDPSFDRPNRDTPWHRTQTRDHETKRNLRKDEDRREKFVETSPHPVVAE